MAYPSVRYFKEHWPLQRCAVNYVRRILQGLFMSFLVIDRVKGLFINKIYTTLPNIFRRL